MSPELDFDTKIVTWVLSGLYFLLIILPILQLIRIHRRDNVVGWTIQKLFLLFTLFASLVRSVFFGVVFLLGGNNFFLSIANDSPTFVTLSNIPRVIFFTSFTFLLLFWAEIIHRVENMSYSFNTKRIVFIVCNVFVYFIQIAIWIILFFFNDLADSVDLSFIESIFFAVLSFLIGVLFIIFGGRLFLMLRSFPVESSGRKNKLIEVSTVTIICVCSFFIRSAMLIITSIDQDLDYNPYVILSYYIVVEVMPALLVLAILSRLPPKETIDSPRMVSSADGSYVAEHGSQSGISGDERPSLHTNERLPRPRADDLDNWKSSSIKWKSDNWEKSKSFGSQSDIQ